MNILFQLYLAFFQVGAFSFGGGYAALPLIQQVIVYQHQWLTTQEMVDIISISQMTPGPIAINSATFVGTKIAGFPGAVIATAGSVTPQFILMMVLAYFFFGNYELKFMYKILKGVKPGIVGLIFIAALSMAQDSLFDGGVAFENLNPVALVCFVVGLLLFWRKVDIIKLIGIGAVLGILLSLFI